MRRAALSNAAVRYDDDEYIRLKISRINRKEAFDSQKYVYN